MSNQILRKVKPDEHTPYMACFQYIDWKVDAFTCGKIRTGFIVQEIQLQQMLDGQMLSSAHYYEAWKVENGSCYRDEYQVSDDLFCIGHPLNTEDALRESIGHSGKISFQPNVFWIEEGQPLFNMINVWPTNVVKEANGLRAVYHDANIGCLFKNIVSYSREPFHHEWQFDDPDIILPIILDYCRKMFHAGNKLDKCNFKTTLDDFFPKGVYPEVKALIETKWEQQ